MASIKVTISRKAVSCISPELQAGREQQARQEIAAGMADLRAGRVEPGKDVLRRMRQRVLDASL